MKDETSFAHQKKEWRDWLTSWASIGTPPLLALCVWVVHLMLANERLESSRANDEKYVPKAEYKENSTLIWSKINATNEKLDTIHTDVVHLQDSVQSLERTLIGTQTLGKSHGL